MEVFGRIGCESSGLSIKKVVQSARLAEKGRRYDDEKEYMEKYSAVELRDLNAELNEGAVERLGYELA